MTRVQKSRLEALGWKPRRYVGQDSDGRDTWGLELSHESYPSVFIESYRPDERKGFFIRSEKGGATKAVANLQRLAIAQAVRLGMIK